MLRTAIDLQERNHAVLSDAEQRQAATATLSSARRIEVLRGPVAQLYGNAAGGVVQVFTAEPPLSPEASYGMASVCLGSDNQKQNSLTLGLAGKEVGGLLDLSHYKTGVIATIAPPKGRSSTARSGGKPPRTPS